MGPGYWGGEGFTFMWIFPLLFFIVFLVFYARHVWPGALWAVGLMGQKRGQQKWGQCKHTTQVSPS